jgi:hypothetical protein
MRALNSSSPVGGWREPEPGINPVWRGEKTEDPEGVDFLL